MAMHLTNRSGNPALTADTFRRERALSGTEAMTISGTVNKTALALIILFAAASFTWDMGVGDGRRVGGFIKVGVLGGPRRGTLVGPLERQRGRRREVKSCRESSLWFSAHCFF